jgi:hypothetical protein
LTCNFWAEFEEIFFLGLEVYDSKVFWPSFTQNSLLAVAREQATAKCGDFSTAHLTIKL